MCIILFSIFHLDTVTTVVPQAMVGGTEEIFGERRNLHQTLYMNRRTHMAPSDAPLYYDMVPWALVPSHRRGVRENRSCVLFFGHTWK